jgi:DNA-binding beta-propeller fold protein YncE
MPPESADASLHFKRALVAIALVLLLVAAVGLGWATLTGMHSDQTQTESAEPPQTTRNGSDEPAGDADRVGAADSARKVKPPAELSAPTDASGDDKPSSADAPAENRLPPDPFPRKFPVPAAIIEGAEWLNTAGPITWDALRGKVLLLDFWTYCCINCMHVLPDLKRLEEKYPDQLVVIGVHSAKFDTERDAQNIRQAILRYEIKHPVINDAEMVIWQRFGVRAWPTLMLIDPEGNAVAATSGERVYDELDDAIDRLVKYHRAKGTLNQRPVHFELEQSRVADTPLRFPGKVLADAASDRLCIADSNHNRIVITTLAGKLVEVIGSGQAGLKDGAFDEATFFRPQGMALDGDTLYVADTENHAIRRVDLKSRRVTTVAGTGRQGSSRSYRPAPAAQAELNSPWDLWLHDGKLYIAMAGPHQIWLWDAETNTVRAYAGSGREDIEDGPLPFAAFAQPSGLASDGRWLFVADSEGSSIRVVPLDPDDEVRTVVGTAHLFEARLFTFGDEDGENGRALLQHPLGVAWADGKLYAADTYNNKIKLIDPENQTSTTLLGDGEPGNSDDPPRFDEPSGVSAASGRLYVADTNNHLIRVIELESGKVSTLELAGLIPSARKPSPSRPSFPNARQITLPEQTLAAGADAELRIKIQLPEAYKLNDLAPISYLVEAGEGPAFVRGEVLDKLQQLAEPEPEFSVPFQTTAGGAGQLRVSLTYFRCREGASGLCEVMSVIWEVPIRLSASATQRSVELVAAEPEAIVP